MKLHIVNPNDRDCTRNRYILTLGQICPSYHLIWANGLEDALDTLVDECCPERYLESERESFHECVVEARDEILDECTERPDDEELDGMAWERVAGGGDWTLAGNASDPISSDDWNIDSENPSREHIKWLISEYDLEVVCAVTA